MGATAEALAAPDILLAGVEDPGALYERTVDTIRTEGVLAAQFAINEAMGSVPTMAASYSDETLAPQAEEEPTRSRLYEAAVRSKWGERVVGAFATLSIGAPLAGALGAEAADATDVASTPAGSVTMVVKNASQNAHDVATKKIVFGEDVRIKADKKGEQDCHYTKGPWTNSVKLANGKLYYYTETKRAKLCDDKYSPTGQVKVSGGETGRDCHNPARDKATKQHKGVKVVNVRSLNTSFTLKAHAIANANANCPGSSASGSAEATVKQKFNLRSYLKTSGSAQVKTQVKLYDKAEATANASAHCDSTEITIPAPPTPTPPTPPPTPEHGCSVSTLTDKTGRTVEATIVNDTSAAVTQATETWGDGSSSTSTQPKVGHTYNNDGTYLLSVHENFGDGGAADCATNAVVKQANVPAPPAP